MDTNASDTTDLDDLDELTATNVALDISAVLDDHEPPPDPNAPVFTYESAGGDDSHGYDWFVVQVIRNDGETAWFRITVQSVTDTNWGGDDG